MLHQRCRSMASPLFVFETPGDIHFLLKNTHHIDIPAVGDPEEQDVRADGQFAVAKPNVIGKAALSSPVRQSFAGLADAQNIALGLCYAPIMNGVVPDCAEIVLCSGGETRAVHSG